MSFARAKLTTLLVCAVLGLVPEAILHSQAAGVTLITHGLNGDTDGWVHGMADAIPQSYIRATDAVIYRFQFVLDGGFWVLQPVKLSGGNPLTTPTAEIVILLDWRNLADGNSYDTYQIAPVAASALTTPGFLAELGMRPLAEFPIHLIGHSRGGSLVCETSRILGTQGLWVDQVTTLDAHPLNNDGFIDAIYTAVDAPARVYENVLFADSYYQDSNFFVYGEALPGSAWRKQTELSGGYTDILTGSHSDVHLWYHATIDWDTPAWDYEAYVTSVVSHK